MPDKVTAYRHSGPAVRELRESFWDNMRNTRRLATEARQLLAGQLGIVLPERVKIAGADTWLGDLPHKRTGPQKVRQQLIAEEWEIKRPVTGGGQRASSVATRIEQPLQAIMMDEDAGFPDADIKDILLLEGIAFSTVSLAPSDWRQTSTLYGPDGKLEYRFSMDRDGKFRGDDGYDEKNVDLDGARRDMEQEKYAYMARHLPFRQRPYSIRQCAPMWGSDFQLEGLIVETHWSATKLRQRGMYVGKNKDGHDCQLYPLGAIGEGDSQKGAGDLVKVIEAWLLDEDGLPYLSYYVDGKAGLEYVFRMTDDGPEDYVIDLSKIAKDKNGHWKGYSRLPVTWGNGLGWSGADIDERFMPFTKPFQQGWRMADMMMTCVVASCLWMAFPALIEKVPFANVDDDGLGEKERQTPDIGFLGITQVTGDITNIGSQGPHPSVFEAMSMVMGENKQEAPGGEGQGANSGIGMSIAEAVASDALTTVKRSALKMASKNASLVLEGAKILGECYEPIRVYQIADVLIEQQNPSDTDQMLTLEPGLIGNSYDVKAIEKKVPGSNPALRQQNAALVTEGFYDRTWFYEQEGYPSPEEMDWRVQWQKIIDSEPGQQATLNMYSAYVSKKMIEQIQDLIKDGEADDQGMAMGFGGNVSTPPEMQGMGAPGGMLEAGPQAPGNMGGMGVPNPAAASLAGAVSAGMQTGPIQNIADAGGALPVTPLQGAVR